MDEADCCSLPKSLDEAGCILCVPESDGHPGNDAGKCHAENILNVPVQENRWLLSSFPVARESDACGKHSAHLSLNENGSSVAGRVPHGHHGHLPTQNGDDRMVTTPSCHSQSPERGQSGLRFALATELEANDEACHNHSASCDATNSSDLERRLHGVCSRDDAPVTGVDETDQGQVVTTLNLTENKSEYSPQLSKAQYYTKQRDGFLRSPVLDTTVPESSGRTGSTCNLQAVINDTPATSRQDDTSSATSSCAISQSGTTTVQGQPQPNSRPPLASSRPVEPEEVTKRKKCLPEEEGDDLSGMIKKQKVSPTSQSDMQYNQNILSMPRQYRVGGTGNYVFDSPNNCTFHLYQNHCSNLSQKQHAFEWAGLSTQTDSVAGVMPAQALETVAKLIAQTTNWKTFARRLPMSDCGSLETDIRTLEECQGTTSDKTSAVLMRWWRGHPEQADATAMKARLKEGLESCSLIRLARTLDKYL